MEEPFKLQDLLRYRATMIWDGYVYQRERIGNNRSWWRCRRNRPRDKEARMCMGRAVFKNQKLTVTVEHSHGPETRSQNFVPWHCRQSSNKDSLTAVKGFVLPTDQALLQSKPTGKVSEEEYGGVGEPPSKRPTLPNYRSTMIWDGFMYHRERIGKKCSWWRCRRNRPQDGESRQCFARGVYEFSDQELRITVKHTHGPESKYQNYVPPPCGPSKKDSAAVVKGFVLPTDQDLLQSKVTDVVKHHQCDLCEMKFAIARVLETHKMLEHQVCAQWKCSECGMQFLQAESRDHHMRLSHPSPDGQHGVATASDAVGDAVTAPKDEKMLQDMNTEEEKKMVEPYAGIEERIMELLTDGEENLLETKSGEKIKTEKLPKKERQMHKCDYCSAEFRHPCKLKMHIRQHTGERPYTCTMCPKTFASGSRRGAHFKFAHAKVRKHLCDWCGKKFTKLEVLNEHVRTHTGEKPFSCHICSRQFRKKNAMTVHIRQHTGEKPYVCDQCGQSFTVKVSLRAHLKSKHNIIVKAELPGRTVPSGDGSIPRIGRPKKSDAEKQLFRNLENGDLDRKDEKLNNVHSSSTERKDNHLKLNNVNASSSGILDCSVFTLPVSDSDVIPTGAFCSIPQF